MTMRRIAFLPAADDGCAFWRMWMPHLSTPNSKYVLKTPMPLSEFSDCNLVMVQRLATEANYATLRSIRDLGFKIVYDLDDDMWSIQAANPASEFVKKIPRYEEGFAACIELCDILTVSTSVLEKAVKTKLHPKIPVKVVRNAVDLNLLKKTFVPREEDKVVIGWAGSTTHAADLAQMGNTLVKILRKYKNVWLHFIGMHPHPALIGHPRVKLQGWVPTKQYLSFLSTWNWDIFIAPLEDNRFNRSKSSIKLVEAGALEKPCLISPVENYLEFASHRNINCVCKTPEDWEKRLSELIEDESIRQWLGQEMRLTTEEFYSMDTRKKEWESIFEELLP